MTYLRMQEESGRIGALSVVEARRAELELGSAKCLNVVLLGAAARSGTLGLSVEDMSQRVAEAIGDVAGTKYPPTDGTAASLACRFCPALLHGMTLSTIAALYLQYCRRKPGRVYRPALFVMIADGGLSSTPIHDL